MDNQCGRVGIQEGGKMIGGGLFGRLYDDEGFEGFCRMVDGLRKRR